MLAQAIPILTIVALLFWMGFFMLATPPLLTLKHDTPMDSRFIRNLFNVYYNVLMALTALGALGCALSGSPGIALGVAGFGVFVFAVRRRMLADMDRLRGAIPDGDTAAIRSFRQLHVGGMVLNLAQIGAVVWGLLRLTASPTA